MTALHPHRIIALFVLLAALLAGCAGSPAGNGAAGRQPKGPNDPVRIGLSFDILNNIRQAEKAAVEAKARTMGASVEFVVADSDAQRQVSQIDELLAKQVDAIIVIAQDKDAMLAGVKRANAVGVPVLTLDRAVTGEGQVLFHVSADPFSDGKSAASFMRERAGATGAPLKALVLVGALSDVNAVERNRGFKETVAGASDVSVVAEMPTEWNTDKALAATRDALRQHPELNAIFCPSDYLLPSVLSAVQDAGRLVPSGEPGHITIVSIDGDPFGYSKTTDGTIAANVATLADVMAARVTEVAVQAARGQQPGAPVEIVPGLLFQTNNAKEVAAKVWGAQVAP